MPDVFICHASEDKDVMARPLARALVEEGLQVWFDEFSLALGDSLRQSIDRGLADSRYGVVILSPAFFRKNWPQRELDGLVAKEMSVGKTILPVWHGVGRADVERFSLPLADKLAVSTSSGLKPVVEAVLGAIRPPPRPVVSERRQSDKRDIGRIPGRQTRTSFDHDSFKELFDFAYSAAGLNLSSREAAKWAERNAGLDLPKFQELFDFAYSAAGLNLSSREATAWALARV